MKNDFLFISSEPSSEPQHFLRKSHVLVVFTWQFYLVTVFKDTLVQCKLFLVVDLKKKNMRGVKVSDACMLTFLNFSFRRSASPVYFHTSPSAKIKSRYKLQLHSKKIQRFETFCHIYHRQKYITTFWNWKLLVQGNKCKIGKALSEMSQWRERNTKLIKCF